MGIHLSPRRLATGLALPVLSVVVWQLAGDSQGRIPTPVGVAAAAQTMILAGELQTAVGVSLERVLIGFAIAATLGVGLGLLMGFYRPVERNLDPLVQTFRNVAAIALVPLAIIWLGPKGQAAIAIVAYGAFFPVIVNTVSAAHAVDRVLIRAARTMGLDSRRIFQTVLLPGSLPTIFVGLRIGMGTAWGAIIAAELTVGATAPVTSIDSPSLSAAAGGIGFLMFYLFDNRVDLNQIVVAMIAVGVMAYLIDRLLRLSQASLVPWASHAG